MMDAMLRVCASRLQSCKAVCSIDTQFSHLILQGRAFEPRRSAAPAVPAILPEAARSALMITSRSARWNVEIVVISGGEAISSPVGTFSSSPCDRSTARSMKFANSRTFPLQG
jgi:hypothetical protein